MKWNEFFAPFSISTLWLGLGRSHYATPPPPYLGMFFCCSHWPTLLHNLYTHLFSQRLKLLCRKLLSKIFATTGYVILHMLTRCLDAMNHLCGLERESYISLTMMFAKSGPKKSEPQMNFS